MQRYFSDKVDPWKLTAAAGGLEGDIPLERLPRLITLLSKAEGQIHFVLEAGIDERGVRWVRGHIEAAVILVCQRCMEPMPLPVDVDFQLGVIYSESQVSHLPSEYDPLLVPEEGVKVSELVEDELILALPLASMHADVRQCEALGFVLPEGDTPAGREAGVNPFAVLSILKESKHQE